MIRLIVNRNNDGMRSNRLALIQSLSQPDDWREIENADCLLICHDGDRSIDRNGLAFSTLIDPVGDSLERGGFRVATIAHPWSVLLGDKAHRNPKSCNRASARYLVAQRAIRRLPNLGRRIAPASGEKFWARVMQVTGARAIVLIGAPTEICRAAGRLGVPVIELLHGFGYRSLPWGYGSRPKDSLPSHFIAFDEVSFNSFVTAFGEDSTFRAIRPDSVTSASHVSTLAKHDPPPGQKAALVTLGWQNHENGRFIDFAPTEVIPAVVRIAIEGGNPGVRWFLRPHPVMMRRSPYSRHLHHLRNFIDSHSNCAAIEESTVDLTHLLKKVDSHITMFSEATYEASFAGVPTLLLSKSLGPDGGLHGNFSDLVQSGLAEIAPDIHAEDLVDWVLNCSPLSSESMDGPILCSVDDIVLKIFHQYSIEPMRA